MPYPRFVRRLFDNDGAGPKLLGSIIPTHYGSCSTAAATVEKAVALTGFVLATGARVTVRFTVTNTAANPTLNVNSTGAKAIKYRNAAITAGALAANRVYEFVYDGADWELVGDLDTNTTYTAFTKATASAAGKAGLVPAPAAGKQNALLRGDGTWADIGSIFPADEQETLRKLSIGAPKLHRSTTLPPNHAWPDGSLVLFADWPELKAVYDAGGFAGMLMAYNANATTQAANLGKFRPNAANPTGLYLPLHGGQFFRAWTLGQTEDAGAWGEDQMQRLTGEFYRESAPNQGFLLDYQLVASGVFGFTAGPTQDSQSKFSGVDESRAWAYAPIDFDSARVARSGTETVPSHIRQPVIIYLGRPR